jgi:Cu-Zn family superoxide dismutase
MLKNSVIPLAAALALVGTCAFAQSDAIQATAALKGADGANLGSATLTQTPAGVLISAELTGLPAGVHGFHLHETGKCEPPFESAGGHFNPTGAEHGYVAGGPHAGDMPNVHVPDAGSLTLEVLNTEISLEDGAQASLFDADGSALLVHMHGDDYRSQPSGEAGDRIACGVVEKKG